LSRCSCGRCSLLPLPGTTPIRRAFSEGLQLAERGGIDPRLAAEVMSTSSIGSPMLKARVPVLLDLPERAWFDVTMMHKDISLRLRRLTSSRSHSRPPASQTRS
jgi:3-hydroxyisobutyrate dehydrogenase-like beta-hydroxyacid dehydrogenase